MSRWQGSPPETEAPQPRVILAPQRLLRLTTEMNYDSCLRVAMASGAAPTSTEVIGIKAHSWPTPLRYLIRDIIPSSNDPTGTFLIVFDNGKVGMWEIEPRFPVSRGASDALMDRGAISRWSTVFLHNGRHLPPVLVRNNIRHRNIHLSWRKVLEIDAPKVYRWGPSWFGLCPRIRSLDATQRSVYLSDKFAIQVPGRYESQGLADLKPLDTIVAFENVPSWRASIIVMASGRISVFDQTNGKMLFEVTVEDGFQPLNDQISSACFIQTSLYKPDTSLTVILGSSAGVLYHWPVSHSNRPTRLRVAKSDCRGIQRGGLTTWPIIALLPVTKRICPPQKRTNQCIMLVDSQASRIWFYVRSTGQSIHTFGAKVFDKIIEADLNYRSTSLTAESERSILDWMMTKEPSETPSEDEAPKIHYERLVKKHRLSSSRIIALSSATTGLLSLQLDDEGSPESAQIVSPDSRHAMQIPLAPTTRTLLESSSNMDHTIPFTLTLLPMGPGEDGINSDSPLRPFLLWGLPGAKFLAQECCEGKPKTPSIFHLEDLINPYELYLFFVRITVAPLLASHWEIIHLRPSRGLLSCSSPCSPSPLKMASSGFATVVRFRVLHSHPSSKAKRPHDTVLFFGARGSEGMILTSPDMMAQTIGTEEERGSNTA